MHLDFDLPKQIPSIKVLIIRSINQIENEVIISES